MNATEEALVQIQSDLSKLTIDLEDHKERHAMVMDMLIGTGKLLLGIATFFTLVGGAIFAFYKFILGA